LEVEDEDDGSTEYIVIDRLDGHGAYDSFREGGVDKLKDEIINGGVSIMQNT